MKKNHLLLALCLQFTFLFSFGQSVQKHSRAKIFGTVEEIKNLARLGIAVDHGIWKKGVFFISEFSENELQLIQNSGLEYEVMVEDVTAFYKARNAMEGPAEKSDNDNGCANEGINYPSPSNFALGSMAGFFTYQEFLDHLDNMRALFPNLITARDTISGFATEEGRPIYWVKISDQPEIDEGEPEILYTALHHAREPASLSQLIFYMYYLLENYQTDEEVKYLVDHTEMYFIPMINPDGYLYNEAIEPDGGGMWRKNRKDNGGGTFGVDLNRNYGYNWGYDNEGSSPDPNSSTFRGDSAFSETETQAIRAFANDHEFRIALNYHTFGNLFIYPWGFEASLFTPDSAVFEELAIVMTSQNSYTFGTGDQTVGYVTNGDSDDWMYGEQAEKNKILSYTPEVGSDDDWFWPEENRIVALCKDNLFQNLYAAHLVNKYAKINDQNPSFFPEKEGFLKFDVQSLGLDTPASFTVSALALGEGIQLDGVQKTFNDLSLLQKVLDSIPFTLADTLQLGSCFSYEWVVSNGAFEFRDTITKTYGQLYTAFEDMGNDLNLWTGNWDLTDETFYSPSSSITDSPGGEYNNNTVNTMTLSTPIDLRFAQTAALRFWAKWEIESGWDYAQILASTDNAVTWQPLCGDFTRLGNGNQDLDQPIYDGFQTEWVQEEIDLSNYVGNEVLLRFQLVSDFFVTEDGYFFDDLQVLTTDTNVSISALQNQKYYLGQNAPNPATGTTTITYLLPNHEKNAELVCYDLTGKVLQRLSLDPNEKSIKMDVRGWAEGFYSYRMEINGRPYDFKKMIIIK